MDWISLASIGAMFLAHLVTIVYAVVKSKNKTATLIQQLTSSHQAMSQEVSEIKTILTSKSA